MTDRELLLKILMGAILSAAQRATMQGYLLRVEMNLPLSAISKRQVKSIAVAARIVGAPSLPPRAPSSSLKSLPMFDGTVGNYSSQRSAGTEYAEKLLAQPLPKCPPGRKSA